MICWLLVLCAISFVAAVALFLRTNGMRRGLDDVLGAAAAKEGGASALVVPERCWTYERDYMRAFIDAIAEKSVPGKPGESWLSVYAGPILGWDMAFAAAFACFVVLAWLAAAVALPADRLWGWAPRVCLFLAAMGAAYGVADIAEDVKLRRIFRTAREIRAKTETAPAPPPPGVGENFDPETAALAEAPGSAEAAGFKAHEPEPEEVYDDEPPREPGTARVEPPAAPGIESEPLDDAEVDAANALTRIKLVTIWGSLLGALVFGLLSYAGKRLPRRGAAVKSS